MESGSIAADSRGAGRFRLWTLVPLALLAAVVLAFAATGDSLTSLVRRQPAAGRRVRHSPGRVPSGRDPDPRHEPAAGRPDDRHGHGRRRDRAVLARRTGDARAAAFEHDRRAVRVGRGRADRRRRHQLDRDPDDRGDRRRRGDPRGLRAELPRLRRDRPARRRRSPSRSACSGCRRSGARRPNGSPPSWPSPAACSRSSPWRRCRRRSSCRRCFPVRWAVRASCCSARRSATSR